MPHFSALKPFVSTCPCGAPLEGEFTRTLSSDGDHITKGWAKCTASGASVEVVVKHPEEVRLIEEPSGAYRLTIWEVDIGLKQKCTAWAKKQQDDLLVAELTEEA